MYQYRRPVGSPVKKKVAQPEFQDNIDLPDAGVLLSVPALIETGLFSHNNLFSQFQEGYYSLVSIQLSLVLCLLLRLESIEKISKESPGELGKIIGLDRIPEAKTLRTKIKEIASLGQGQSFLSELSRQWMQNNSNLAGVLYIDGHEKVYSGKQPLPRRYITRLQLAMRGSTDYWVCDKIGQPFFFINKTIHGSMIELIKEEIIPRLEKDVPNQPTEKELAEDHHLQRFMIVYDRECASEDFIIDCWEKRISCTTYKKNVKDLWPEEEFTEYEIENQFGVKEPVLLAERAVLITSKETQKLENPQPLITIKQTENGPQVKITQKRTIPKKELWIREVRKLKKNGHQTSILTSNYKLSIVLIGTYMFARWCQENFFKYMLKNFGLDMLVSYFTEKMDDTELLINPLWRKIDKEVRSMQTKLQHLHSKLGAYTFDNVLPEKETAVQQVGKYYIQKADLIEQINILTEDLQKIKQKRSETQRKIPFSQLPEEYKFEAVTNGRKQYLDTLKMIAYRAELSLVNSIAPYVNDPKSLRSLMVQFFKSSADLHVDKIKKTLHVKIHNQPRHMDNKILDKLCKILNETETKFPQTDLQLVYEII